jgi:hypothetical protein
VETEVKVTGRNPWRRSRLKQDWVWDQVREEWIRRRRRRKRARRKRVTRTG